MHLRSTAIRDSIGALMGDIAQLRGEVAWLRRANEALRAENEVLRAENAAVRGENEALRSENAGLRAEVRASTTIGPGQFHQLQAAVERRVEEEAARSRKPSRALAAEPRV